MGIFGTSECNVTSDFLDPPICCAGGGGTLLGSGPSLINFPDISGTSENGLAVIYLVLLAWMFAGVALAADSFMSAIEQITSTTKVISHKGRDGQNRIFRLRVWNPTVANLTLMALGSSAPEILLSLIELLFNDFYAGELGPSTIVGSAAFNLFVIIAICVPAISADDSRKIVMPYVYAITATASVLAYVWLIIILVAWTPDEVTLMEALLTLIFFPILVIFAYYADKWGDLRWRRQHPIFKHCVSDGAASHALLREVSPLLLDVKNPDGSPLTPAELLSMVKRLQRSQEEKMPEDKAVAILSRQLAAQQPRSRAYYRVKATRGLASGSASAFGAAEQQGLYEQAASLKRTSSRKVAPEEDPDERPPPAEVAFCAPTYSVVEAAGKVTVQVRRTGSLAKPLTVQYTTEDGEGAHAATVEGGDYKPQSGSLHFAAGEATQDITLTIFDDDEEEPDEHFFVRLTGVEQPAEEALGAQSRTRVTIINDDFPGTFVVLSEDVKVREGCGAALVQVARVQGCSGRVSMQYRTIDGSAVGGVNYTAVSGTLEWGHQEVGTQTISIPITDDNVLQGKQTFDVEISAATGGAIFDAATDGDVACSLAHITIEDDERAHSIADRALSLFGVSQQSFDLGRTSWKQQFHEALRPQTDADDDAAEGAEGADGANGSGSSPTATQWAMHALFLPFKLLCACVPPTTLGNGWPCFVCSLILIGALTALIGDLANLLGCALGLKSSVVAITLVALGTSLPDTFASRTAAQRDPSADAAVGNVTGSNAVNVFLGVGLAWFCGALYWQVNGVSEETIGRYAAGGVAARLQLRVGESRGLIVPAGDLGLSVIVFVVGACVCIAVLSLRRLFLGYELGGKYRWPTAALLVGLWFMYVTLSTVQAYSPFYSSR